MVTVGLMEAQVTRIRRAAQGTAIDCSSLYKYEIPAIFGQSGLALCD